MRSRVCAFHSTQVDNQLKIIVMFLQRLEAPEFANVFVTGTGLLRPHRWSKILLKSAHHVKSTACTTVSIFGHEVDGTFLEFLDFQWKLAVCLGFCRRAIGPQGSRFVTASVERFVFWRFCIDQASVAGDLMNMRSAPGIPLHLYFYL